VSSTQRRQALQRRVRDDDLHQPHAEAAPAMLREHEHVGEVRERRVVGDDPREADLVAGVEQAERERVLDRAHHQLARNSARPVRGGQGRVHDVEVDARRVGGDQVLVSSPLVRHGADPSTG
jgi:hypothetical protein